MKGWSSWLTYRPSGCLTHISGHPSVERKTGKVRRRKTDALTTVPRHQRRDATVEGPRATVGDGGRFSKRTARRRDITGEGPRDVAWRGVTAEGPRDAVVLMERDRAESRSWQPLIDYFTTILLAAQNFFATIWAPIEILRSLVWTLVNLFRIQHTKNYKNWLTLLSYWKLNGRRFFLGHCTFRRSADNCVVFTAYVSFTINTL